MIPHRRYKGGTGSGKTNAASDDLLELAKDGEYWITAVYPHPQWGELFIAELYHEFGDEIFNRLIVERLTDVDKVIPRQYLYASQDPDPYKRAMENDGYRQAFIDILLPMQEKSTIGDQPSKAENLNLVIDVKQNMDVWMPDSWIHHILEKHPVNEYAKLHVPQEQKLALEAIDKLDPKSRQMGPGSAVRLMKPSLGSPVLQVRTFMPENMDDVAFKNTGGIRVILGDGDLSKDALRVHVGSDFQRTVRDAKRRLLDPGVYFIDEATNYGLYGQFESDALSTVRAFGISMWHAIQSENYSTPEIARNVAQNVDDRIFRQTDPDEAYRAARTINAARDRYQIHHEDVSYRSVETDEIISRKGKSVTKGEKGKSVTESDQFIQKKEDKEVKTPRYDTLNEQTEYRSQELMTLLPGEHWVNERGRAPYKTRARLFPDSWGFAHDKGSLAQDKSQECIQILKSRPPYVTPVKPEFPTMPKGKKGMQT